MTLSTSLVAVWYSSDSCSSRGARLHLLEQPRVLYRDHCLIGKGCDELDLPAGERPNLQSVDHEDAHQIAGLQHRNRQYGPDWLHLCRPERVLRVGPNV